ncbi:MAG: electron transfer flavoprotein subunit alpha/FixB family protein, partial [Roseiarcus sp.]
LLTNRPLIGYATSVSAQSGYVEVTSQAHGGKLHIDSRAPLPVVVTIMPGAFPEAALVGTPEIVLWPPPPRLQTLRTQFVAEAQPELSGLDLANADKVVCVGRGVKDQQALEAARKMATAMGAAIAGSRPVIDNGWLPKERQVGKSGRTVKPKLYVALGVSGSPEHLEGMANAELIVAINTDENAPIFGAAHYGAICDAFELISALNERLDAVGAPT